MRGDRHCGWSFAGVLWMNIDFLGVSKVADSVLGGLDGLFTSDDERNQAKIKVMEILARQDSAQAYINSIDAQSQHFWQYGWRPSIAWAGTAALIYTWVGKPLLLTVYAATGWAPLILSLPDIPMDSIQPMIIGMLGLGAMRSYDKNKKR
jgi:hypothetical protein